MQKSELQKRIKEDILKRINSEEDYVHCKKFANSLNKFLAKFSDGVEYIAIARILMIPEEQVQAIYDEAVRKLRAEMVKKDES